VIGAVAYWTGRHRDADGAAIEESERATWLMPPLDELPPGRFTPTHRVWMGILRAYLLIASALVLARIVQLLSSGH